LDPAQHGFAIIEAGISAPGDMAPLARMIEPDVAVVTLVDHAHTRDLGGIDGVAREKAGLPAAVREHGVAFLPQSVNELETFRQLPVRRLAVERADVLRPATTDVDRIFYTMTQRCEETVVTVAYPADNERPESYGLRRVSDGMAQNAVLAICVARWLGVTPDVIRQRLAGWGSAPLRGEVRQEKGRLLYVDCYNANPASMRDALKAFQELTDQELGTARLYVIGGMEELGAECESKHRELGTTLGLHGSDHAIVIGTGSVAVRDGAVAAGATPEQIEVVDDLAGVAERVAAWTGPVFIKGSRRYRLETLLGESSTTAHT
jgi:UDP-N-acetylmuramoyl-tripeptide--D-alanyl-D-alanine ligase